MVEWLINNVFEWAGLVTGVLCVWLMIRENYLTFPIGLLYAVITVVVVFRAQLYADVLLNLYYVVMNAYGWYFWRYARTARHRQAAADNPELVVGQVSLPSMGVLCFVILAGTVLMGIYFDRYTNAALPYPDSFTTVASFVAMWMSARKYLESWLLWLVVNVVQVVLYLVKGIEAYAILYFIYVIMAIHGWRTWRQALPVVEQTA